MYFKAKQGTETYPRAIETTKRRKTHYKVTHYTITNSTIYCAIPIHLFEIFGRII